MVLTETQPSVNHQEADSSVDRYSLLHTQFPPPEAFDKKTLPYLEEKKIVYRHALCLERDWSAQFWQETIDQLTEQERQDFQIVVIPPRGEKRSNHDFCQGLILQLGQVSLPHPLAILKRIPYEEIEYGKVIENMSNPASVFIICSSVTEDDLSDIIAVADAYKDQGVKQITLIAPFIRDEREDKNVSKSPDCPQGRYNGRLIKIKTVMATLGQSGINRVITFEPHSGATQAFAAISGLPVAPLSLEKELTAPLVEQIRNNSQNWVIIRPDEGRNLVATRMEKKFNISGVHLEKIRDSDTLETKIVEQENNQLNRLQGKNTLLYDDEGGTLGTIKNIVLQRLVPAKVRSINICLAHARLQKNWRQNLDEIIKACQEANIDIKIIFSNSRRPLGNLRRAINAYPSIVSVVGVENTITATIEACVNGINFWHDDNWAQKVLQPIKGYDEE